MSDRYAGGIKAASTSVSHNFVLRAVADGTEVTGKVAADMTVSYWRQGGVRVAITPADLAAVNSAYSSGGVKEVDATNQPGLYRLDLPDAALATGADWVTVSVKVANALVFHERLPLETKGAAENNTIVAAIKLKTDLLISTNAGKIDAAIIAAGDLAQAAADKAWLTSARTITGLPTVSLTSSVWDEVAASHNTSGTMGQKMNSAAAATDPLLNAVPGAYAAGTAGAALGALGTDSATIAAINAKTVQLTFTNPGVVDANASGGVTPAAVAAAVLNTAMVEGYAARGAQATLTQALYAILQYDYERSVSGTTETIKKLDGATTAITSTTNSATNPTSHTRTT